VKGVEDCRGESEDMNKKDEDKKLYSNAYQEGDVTSVDEEGDGKRHFNYSEDYYMK
jgi:hypothetical protein